jgi:steroid delta-isomerase-like uncharacterized protein
MSKLSISLICLLAACSGAGRTRSLAQSNGGDARPVLEAFVRAWNQHDSTALDSLVAPGAVHEDLALGFRGVGAAEFKGFMRQTYGMIPDFDWRTTLVLVDGSRLAAEWTLAGTYTGDTPSGPVRGRRFSIRGASILLTEGGKITRFSDYYNPSEFYRQVTSPSAK